MPEPPRMSVQRILLVEDDDDISELFADALREEGYEVVLVNSNPATIMTDPMMADRIYLLTFLTHSC